MSTILKMVTVAALTNLISVVGMMIPKKGNDDDDDFYDDDDDGFPANSPHDKIPPWWEYVINR